MRQAERFLKDLDSSGEEKPSSASDQRENVHGNSNKRVGFADQSHVYSNKDGDTDTQFSGQEAAPTRKRTAGTDARRPELEAERFELDERASQKRKAEGDPNPCKCAPNEH